jgi:hypothetical protein
MSSRAEIVEEIPTAVPSPRLSEKKLGDDVDKPIGVAITATNTIDTLEVDQPRVAREDEAAPALAHASTARKLGLLTMFVLAEFLDAFNNSALFPAIPDIVRDLQFEQSETVWIISAYQLTFAAFLLVVSCILPFILFYFYLVNNGYILTQPYRAAVSQTFTPLNYHSLRELSSLVLLISLVALLIRRSHSLSSAL